jgi:hypothetical protein
MNLKKIAIGEDDFKLFRQGDSYFVDKSIFIEQVIEDASRVLLFPRPRRFGKTLNMSMLHYFFTHNRAEENRQLFEGLAITQSPAFEKHQGKYPVIFLSFKSCKGDTYEKIFQGISSVLAKAFREHESMMQKECFTEIDREKFFNISQEKADEALLAQALLLLTDLLNRCYGKKAIILIDEYDTPIHEAYLHGFYEKAVGLLRILLGNALKGNEYLQKGVLTGILRVSKESMFSDLNNIMVYSILSKDFNEFFGFVQHEVDALITYYGLGDQKQQVKGWYNGYYFGDLEVYNPWSILSFSKNHGTYRAYWLGTSANDLVHKLIKDSDNSVKKDIEDALNNHPVVSRIEENISFPHLEASRENILSFLVQTGYLKARYKEMQNSRLMYEVTIPNEELRIIYTDTITLWFQESIGSVELGQMLNALIAGDLPIFERIFSKFVLETLSFFNVGRKKPEVERVFQAFLLGMLINLKDRYQVYSEKESGYGRFDVSLVPHDKSKQAIIMELKSIDTFNNETREQTLDSALKQIEDRNYESLLRQQGCQNIMKLAVTFDGKRVWVKRGE